MKNAICFSLFIFCGISTFAQNQNVKSEAGITQDANKRKTGNDQDFIANLLQFSANNIASSDKNVQLSFNLFALNFKDSAFKYADPYFLKHTYQRNLQFNLNVGLDDNSKINAVQYGVTYNLLNMRDTSLVHYYNEMSIGLFNNVSSIISVVLQNFRDDQKSQINESLTQIAYAAYTNKNSSFFQIQFEQKFPLLNKDKIKINAVKEIQRRLEVSINDNKYDAAGISKQVDYLSDYVVYFYYLGPLNTSFTKYVSSQGKQLQSSDTISIAVINTIIDSINVRVSKIQLLHGTSFKTLSDAYSYLQSQYDSLVTIHSRKPLLTIGNQVKSGIGKTSNENIFSLTFVQGLNNKSLKKPWDLNISFNDSLQNDSTSSNNIMGRNIGMFEIGVNKVLLMSDKTSLMELSVSVENDLVTSGLYKSEKNDKFFFNSVIRARLPNSPWLKFTVKYDPKGNFFGFLDLTLNLDNSSNSSKKSSSAGN